MKLDELLVEDGLEKLRRQLLLRTTSSQISQEQAEAVDKWLDQNGYRLMNGSNTRDKSLTREVKYFKISSTSWKNKDWRLGAGHKERKDAALFLIQHGFKVSRSESKAIMGKALDGDHVNALGYTEHFGNHVFFW